MSQSPYLGQKTQVAVLEDGCALKTSEQGHIPYQRWLIPPWDEDTRYVWLMGNYDFKNYDRVAWSCISRARNQKIIMRFFAKNSNSWQSKGLTGHFFRGSG